MNNSRTSIYTITNSKFSNISIIMNNSLLSNIKNHKYLGVVLDSKLSWIQHISYVKNKVANGIGIIRLEPILIG